MEMNDEDLKMILTDNVLISQSVILKSFNKLFNKLSNTLKCDALRDLVPFAQFKKREKHP